MEQKLNKAEMELLKVACVIIVAKVVMETLRNHNIIKK